MNKTFCDKCKNEIKKQESTAHFQPKIDRKFLIDVSIKLISHQDLCDKCLKKLFVEACVYSIDFLKGIE